MLPTVGMLDAEPVFSSAPKKTELAAILEKVFAAIPIPKAQRYSADYRTPVMELLKLRSGIAFERGLKSASLEIAGCSYRFFRYLPHATFKHGFRREDAPLFTLAIEAPVDELAKRILEALDDETWPTR